MEKAAWAGATVEILFICYHKWTVWPELTMHAPNAKINCCVGLLNKKIKLASAMLLTPVRTEVCSWYTEASMLLGVMQLLKLPAVLCCPVWRHECVCVLVWVSVCVFLPPLPLCALLTKLNGQCISLFQFSLFPLCPFTWVYCQVRSWFESCF